MESVKKKLTNKAVGDVDVIELLKELLPQKISIEAIITTYRGQRRLAIMIGKEKPTEEVKK